MVELVRSALALTGLPAHHLLLEMTESVLLERTEAMLARLHELKALGVRLAIDDFGTGYASLSYVRQLPAHVVKVDRSFVKGIGSNAGDEAIVRSVIGMAHALDQRVVAEGVETLEQRDFLRDLDCDLIQGWLYGRPQPANMQHTWTERVLHPITAAAAA
jgi:EAL domain-containing protein (putative c-di-GMP-specific phosphodiesterase class I)